eukprot:GHVR01126511.1.p1 GENE.GHVR01126511.1~~GHVR01126511.1.p1  ORF type:complete len:218 (+),score=11.66 GHVR01126511.1:198-851(+)
MSHTFSTEVSQAKPISVTCEERTRLFLTTAVLIKGKKAHLSFIYNNKQPCFFYTVTEYSPNAKFNLMFEGLIRFEVLGDGVVNIGGILTVHKDSSLSFDHHPPEKPAVTIKVESQKIDHTTGQNQTEKKRKVVETIPVGQKKKFRSGVITEVVSIPKDCSSERANAGSNVVCILEGRLVKTGKKFQPEKRMEFRVGSDVLPGVTEGMIGLFLNCVYV